MYLTDKQEEELRTEFKKHLESTRPNLSESTVSSYVNWAFYTHKYVSTAVFLEALNSEHGMEEARKQILALADSGGVKKGGVQETSKYTSDYMHPLAMLKEFVNLKYGSIGNYLERK